MAEETKPAVISATETTQKAEGQLESTTEQPVGEGKPAQPSLFEGPWIFIGLGALWLFVLYSSRKNKKAQKERQDDLQNLSKGDKIITIGRVHGEVVKTTEKTFTIKPDSNKDYTLTFDREAILRIVGDEKKEGCAEDVGCGCAK